MNAKSELPDVVTDPKTGKYLLTPTTWNSEEKQALYHIEDLMPLMDAIGGILENPERPQVVCVDVAPDGTFTYGMEIDPMIIDDEGFIKLALISEASEHGQGLVEYALILVMVAIVVIVILVILGPAISNVYSNIVANL